MITLEQLTNGFAAECEKYGFETDKAIICASANECERLLNGYTGKKAKPKTSKRYKESVDVIENNDIVFFIYSKPGFKREDTKVFPILKN